MFFLSRKRLLLYGAMMLLGVALQLSALYYISSRFVGDNNSGDVVGKDAMKMINNMEDPASVLVPKPTSTNETAAICIIAKDEEHYIDEWVDYNLLVLGFDTIYLYDNSENYTLQNYTASYAEAALEPEKQPQERRRRRVVIEHYPYHWKQRAAYKRCIEQHGSEHGWLALLDGDEFLVLKKHDHVTDMLAEHCRTGSLSINWYLFGTSNRTSYEPLPVLYRFQYRELLPTKEHKVILRCADYDSQSQGQKRGVASPHSVHVLNHTTQHDTTGKVTSGPFSPGGPTDVAILHHYMCTFYFSCYFDLEMKNPFRLSLFVPH
jgi:hypothetical protein